MIHRNFTDRFEQVPSFVSSKFPVSYKTLDIKWFIEILLTGSSKFPVSECHVNKTVQWPIPLIETTVSTAKGAGTCRLVQT